MHRLLTCTQRDARFIILGLEEAGSDDTVTISLLSCTTSFRLYLIFLIARTPAARPPVGGGELNFCCVLLLIWWCQRSSLRNSKQKPQSVSFLSPTGLEIHPLRRQEGSKSSLYPTLVVIEKVSLTDDVKSWYFQHSG